MAKRPYRLLGVLGAIVLAVVAAIATAGGGAEDASVTCVAVAQETAPAVGSGRFWHPSKIAFLVLHGTGSGLQSM